MSVRGRTVDRQDRWYAVHTQPHREARAAAQLMLQEFRTFLPQSLRTIRHARQFRTVKRAFFPRYLFVALDVGLDRWRSVNGTSGVTRLVMAGSYPAPAPRGLVEDLIAFCGHDGAIEFSAQLEPGQRVCMLSGPFTERIGELQGIDDAGRVRILLDLMGGKIPVWSEAGVLAPVA
jgi:transcription antitermination factor NusG